MFHFQTARRHLTELVSLGKGVLGVTVVEGVVRDSMTFEIFASFVAGRLDLGSCDLRPGSRLQDDLGFDSLRMFELLYLAEELRGREVDLDKLRMPETLGEVWMLVNARSRPAESIERVVEDRWSSCEDRLER